MGKMMRRRIILMIPKLLIEMLVWHLGCRVWECPRGQPWVVVPCPAMSTQNCHQQCCHHHRCDRHHHHYYYHHHLDQSSWQAPGLIDRVLVQLPPPLSSALPSLLLECSTLHRVLEYIGDFFEYKNIKHIAITEFNCHSKSLWVSLCWNVRPCADSGLYF